jgi:hypothetical protein
MDLICYSLCKRILEKNVKNFLQIFYSSKYTSTNVIQYSMEFWSTSDIGKKQF